MAEVYWTKETKRQMANLPGLGIEIERQAKTIQRDAEALAAGYTDTGDFASSFGTEKLGVDAVVYNSDPAAAMIETGHLATGRGKAKASAKWVPGKFTLAQAIRKNKAA